MGRTALLIVGRYSLKTHQIFVINCTFKFIDAVASIDIALLPFNKTVIVNFLTIKEWLG